MAKIRDCAVTEIIANATTVDCEMPTHAINDILIYFANKDGVAVVNDPAGIWTNLQNAATAGSAYRTGWTLATTSSHTLQLVTGTTDTWTIIVVAIEGANTSTPISGSAASASDVTTMPYVGPTVSTGTDTNCLVLHFWGSDTGYSPTAYAPLINVYAGDNGTNSASMAYTYQKAAGTTTAASWYGISNDDGRGVVIAVKDDGNETVIPPYSDATISSGQVIRPVIGLATTYSDTWPTSLSITALGNNFDNVYVYEVAPSFTDRTSEANNPTTADLTWPMHIGDMVYFGSSTTFASLSFITSTAGSTGVLAWEYGTGHDTWATATGMTGSFTATGGSRVSFTNESIPSDWIETEVNTVTKFWIRARITTAYVTTVPIQSMCRKDGHVAAYIVSTAAADAGTNPYTNACQCAGSSSTANLAGPQTTLGAAVDLSSGILFGTHKAVLPRDYAIDIALPRKKPGGIQLTFLDNSNNYLSYKLGAKGCKSLAVDDRNVFAIGWNNSAIPWATAGTISKSAVTKIFFSTYGYYGASAIQWSMLNLVTRIGISGGTVASPLNLTDIAYITNNGVGIFPFLKVSGSAVTVFPPLQFGGNDPVRVFCNLNTFQFPRIYDGDDYYDFNMDTNVAGVKFYPKTGDVLKFTNCVFTSDSAYRWEWDASGATNATINFDGTSVVRGTVTLQDVGTDFNNMSFISCPSFTLNDAPVTNSAFLDTKVSASSPANAALIENCQFTSSGTGYAMEIGGTAANFSLSGNTFTGYASSNGSTGNEAIYVNIGSGNITITITGGGSTPSIRTAGATVTVENPVTLTLTGLVTGSDISILTAGTTTELINVQENAGTTYGYNYQYTSSTYIDIGVFKSGYIPYYIRTYLLPSTNASVPISQVIDRAYLL